MLCMYSKKRCIQCDTTVHLQNVKHILGGRRVVHDEIF